MRLKLLRGRDRANRTRDESLPRLRSEGEGIPRPAAEGRRALRGTAGGLRVALCWRLRG